MEPGLDESTALEYAQRCLQCGVIVPSVVFRPDVPKKQIVVWDAAKALSLWQKRHPDNGADLPDVFEDIADVSKPYAGSSKRSQLVLKPENAEEMLFYTTDDE